MHVWNFAKMKRTSSFSEIPYVLPDSLSPLLIRSERSNVETNNKQSGKNPSKDVVRRCKSNPERSRRTTQETHAIEDQRAINKEVGYITALSRDCPVQQQPQLSYFAYLGKDTCVLKQYGAVLQDFEQVMTIGNGIFVQNGKARLTNETVSDQKILLKGLKTDYAQCIECCSCLCCVKAIFYHCTKNRELERNWADRPCTCEVPGTECATRWGILGMLSIFLPCVLCYPILKGCVRTVHHGKRYSI